MNKTNFSFSNISYFLKKEEKNGNLVCKISIQPILITFGQCYGHLKIRFKYGLAPQTMVKWKHFGLNSFPINEIDHALYDETISKFRTAKPVSRETGLAIREPTLTYYHSWLYRKTKIFEYFPIPFHIIAIYLE